MINKSNSISARQILEQFPDLLSLWEGDSEAQAHCVSSINNPKPFSLVYISSLKSLEKALQAEASLLILSPSIATAIEEAHLPQSTPHQKYAMLLSNNVNLSMALINQHFFPVHQYQQVWGPQNHHSSAVVSPTAEVALSAILAPGVIIGDSVVIGENSYIGAHTIIEQGSNIGSHCYIGPNNFIGHNSLLEDFVVIHPTSVIGSDGFGLATDTQGRHIRKPHYGRVVLRKHVEIGSGVYIDRGTYDNTEIGEGTKIDNYCHFAHNVQVGKHCLITAGMIVAGSTSIGDHCVFGGRVTINGHIAICDRVMVAPLSGIMNSVTRPGKYGGWPLQSFQDSMKALSIFSKLPDLRKDLKKIKTHLEKLVSLNGH